ncbi:hypothetical protein DFS34DRAFT_693022 [Phlyctochytrium arcticum]|nr:hypothetical protein DFS34DRAFT_693022 [Phlyctochytrium arcticum]
MTAHSDSDTDDDDLQEERRLAKERTGWRREYRDEISQKRQDLLNRVLSQAERTQTRNQPVFGDVSSSDTGGDGEVEEDEIVVPHVKVPGSFKFSYGGVHIPVTFNVKESNDDVVRTEILPIDATWRENLSEWDIGRDCARQESMDWVDYVLRQLPSSHMHNLLFGHHKDGGLAQPRNPAQKQTYRTVRALTKDALGGLETIDLLLRYRKLEGLENETVPWNKRANPLCRVCGMAGCWSHDTDGFLLPETYPKRPMMVPTVQPPSDPCGESCAYSLKIGPNPNKEFTPEELRLLAMGYRCFGRDPCRISVALSSRTCSEVLGMIKTIEDNSGRWDPDARPEFFVAREALRDADVEASLSRDMIIPQVQARPSYLTASVYAEPCDCGIITSPTLSTSRSTCSPSPSPATFINNLNPFTRVCSKSCRCAKSKVYCTNSCACSMFCPYRYPGCNCTDGCQAEVTEPGWRFKPKGKGKGCRCVLESRECDPDLCKSCGAHESWQEAGRNPRCKNQGMLRRLVKQMGVRQSTLKDAGRGAFLLESAKKGDLINEYVGGIITEQETNRRAPIAKSSGLNYVFAIGHNMDADTPTIDANRFGSVTRFINNARNEGAGRGNCWAVNKFVNGALRIGIYAGRAIEAGEELFFDYGDTYEFELEYDTVKDWIFAKETR